MLHLNYIAVTLISTEIKLLKIIFCIMQQHKTHRKQQNMYIEVTIRFFIIFEAMIG